MSLFEHLTELRRRLIRSMLALTVACLASWSLRDLLREWLARPLHAAWTAAGLPGEPTLQVLSLTDKFMVDLRIAATAGLFVAAPVVFYQLWLFVAPGLYRRERRLVLPFAASSAVMFAAGAIFCYLVVLPVMIRFFLGYNQGPADDPFETKILSQLYLNDYVKQATKTLVAFGLTFEFPLLILFLSLAGIVTHRSLLRFWRHATVLCFVVGGVLTPPDPVSQSLLAGPMLALYFASVLVAYVFRRREEPA